MKLWPVQFTSDPAGNLTSRTDARGVTATYHYDGLNRLVGVGYPDPSLDVGYSYDVASMVCSADERFGTGRLSRVQHAGGKTEYCYNYLGQVSRKVQTVSGVSTTLRYGYTTAGRLNKITYPDGSVVEYQLQGGRAVAITLTRPGQSKRIVVDSVRYTPLGPSLGWNYGGYPSLASMTRLVDRNYRTTGLMATNAPGLSLDISYDPTGAVTDFKAGASGATLAKFSHDHLGRLTQTQDGLAGTPIETYTYDATGNRRSMTNSAGTTTYGYEADSHRLSSVGGELRSYDSAGNTLSIGDREFVYDSASRMSQVKRGGVAVEKYLYNHLGERVQRTSLNGAAVLSAYDESGRWLGEYSSVGQALQQVIWLDDLPVAVLSAQSTGVPELAYIQPDHLGTPRVVVDPVRNVAIWEWSNLSEVFGNQVPNTDPDGDGVLFNLALRFPGQQATDASGLFYNYQREYDPVVGRYTQSDPIGLRGGINTYGYASGMPLSKVDAKGLLDVWVWRPLPYEGGLPSYGKLHSTFGHVSATSMGVDYSFGPGGNLISQDYVSKQLQLRGATKHTLKLSPAVETAVAACLARPQPAYSSLTNNCATPVQECLRESGLRMPPNNLILPETLNHFMWWMFDTSEVIDRNEQ